MTHRIIKEDFDEKTSCNIFMNVREHLEKKLHFRTMTMFLLKLLNICFNVKKQKGVQRLVHSCEIFCGYSGVFVEELIVNRDILFCNSLKEFTIKVSRFH